MPEFTSAEVKGSRRGLNREPNECPFCHHSIHAKQHDWSLVREHSDNTLLEIVYKCPRFECSQLFIAQYRLPYEAGTVAELSRKKAFVLFRVHPARPKQPDIPEEVASVSTGFGSIYTQALAAHDLGLDQISGGGLRKALEFLIKDYCISRRPEAAEKIRKKMLGDCIQEFVDDPILKECARRAAW